MAAGETGRRACGDRTIDQPMSSLLPVFILTALLASDPVPRLSFVRTVPAAHDLGHAETLLVVYKVGEARQVDTFVDSFVDRVNNSHLLHAADETRHGPHMIGDGTDPDAERHVRREHAADVYIGVKEFSCGVQERTGERSAHDENGVRIRHQQVWAEAVCHARVDLIAGSTLRKTESFYVRGDGASARVDKLSGDEREAALAEAARRAGAQAAEQVTPRRVRESIELDPDAPDFDRAYALIDAQRLIEARALWERALARFDSSAPLHFNLALLCDALGDTADARKHFAQARRLSPASDRYRRVSDSFQRRVQPKKNAPPKR